jgi:hypothetical protein|tara:strand:+ start:224 stop:439 length:216 start_codon:yes stop_codon:yes gene_type:complete
MLFAAQEVQHDDWPLFANDNGRVSRNPFTVFLFTANASPSGTRSSYLFESASLPEKARVLFVQAASTARRL